MKSIGTLKRGLKTGLHTTWSLGKIIFPVTIAVSILQYTIVLEWIIKAVKPLMSLFGLPGEAAIPLVLGNVLNLYAAIGAMLTLDLTVKQVFIIALMLSFSHALLVESSIAAKVGVNLWLVAAIRIVLASLFGWIVNLAWQGGAEQASFGLIQHSSEEISGWFSIVTNAVQQASTGIFQLAMIVIPLMIAIQWLKEMKWVDKFSNGMSPFTRMLGMKKNTSTTLAAGILFGISFGAGVMLQAAKEDGVAKKDLYLAFIFLVTCHAVVEDTLIFLPLGIPVWPLLLIRLTVAIILTIVTASIWNRIEKSQRKEYGYENRHGAL